MIRSYWEKSVAATWFEWITLTRTPNRARSTGPTPNPHASVSWMTRIGTKALVPSESVTAVSSWNSWELKPWASAGDGLGAVTAGESGSGPGFRGEIRTVRLLAPVLAIARSWAAVCPVIRAALSESGEIEISGGRIPAPYRNA